MNNLFKIRFFAPLRFALNARRGIKKPIISTTSILNNLKKLIPVFLIAIFCSSCKKEQNSGYQYVVPDYLSDGWEICSAKDVDVNSEILCDMMDFISVVPNDNIHSILIFKNDYLIFEEYFEGYKYSGVPPDYNGDYILYDSERFHYLTSVTKSITSAIFGIAINQGIIESEDDKVIDHFPQYANTLIGEKANITLKHLLTMSSGLAWDETTYPYGDIRNDVTALYISDDPIEYILSKPLLSSPGAQFMYNSGTTNVIGALIQNKAGVSLLEYGNVVLFNPLNIEVGLWQHMTEGYYLASGGIFLRPRDLAKIGHLYLNNGCWKGEQFITQKWLNESKTSHILTQGRTLPQAKEYGYQWWIGDFYTNKHKYNSFFAAGWGDQYMLIFPEQDMMIVFNGGNFISAGSISPFSLIEDFILPSLE